MGLFRDNEHYDLLEHNYDNMVKFPTGRRRTSSGYFTRVAENLNSGLPRTNPASGQSGT